MAMKINEAGLNLVKEFEGCYLKAYKCPAGVWTIGYGHTGKVDGKAICEGMTITKEKASDLLKADMAAFEKAVTECSALTFEPNENQFSALVSFAFNCGSGNLKTLVEDRTAAVVAEKILLYNKAAGKVLNGLVRRRKAERELFLTPVKKEEPKKTIEEWAKEVIAGKHGTGHANREKSLKKAGCTYAYEKIRAKVNELSGVKPATDSYYPKYTGASIGIDTVLEAIGVPAKYRGGWRNRKPLAARNGIKSYQGTAEQNGKLISLAKQGRLKKV